LSCFLFGVRLVQGGSSEGLWGCKGWRMGL